MNFDKEFEMKVAKAHIEELEMQLEILLNRFHTREEENEIIEELEYWKNEYERI